MVRTAAEITAGGVGSPYIVDAMFLPKPVLFFENCLNENNFRHNFQSDSG